MAQGSSKSNKSPADELIRRTVLKVHAVDFLSSSRIAVMSHAETGMFLTLAALSAHGPIPNDEKAIAKMLAVRPSVVRKSWPTISRLFVLTRNGYVLSPEAPITARVISTGRTPLRHLFLRLAAFWGRLCVYCGASSQRLDIEHIVPLARGGSDDITNLTLACQGCNGKKGIKTAAEFGHPHVHDKAARIH